LKATLLFAHGARDPLWARPFEAIARQMRAARPERPLVLAYLELMTPTLSTAVDELVEQGADDITLVPLFLGAGGHVRRDLPALIEAARARHAGVQILATCAIGESDLVVRAIAQAAQQLIETRTVTREAP
jgi:sirohydrochlorin cobaltochelatase